LYSTVLYNYKVWLSYAKNIFSLQKYFDFQNVNIDVHC
jgi:hypothetical protein